MGLLEQLIGQLARQEGQGDASKLLSEITAVWEGSEVTFTPVLTTPGGSHWFPALGIEVSANLSEVRPCSLSGISDRVQKSRKERTSL